MLARCSVVSSGLNMCWCFFLRDRDREDSMRRELSQHLRFCLQSTPMNVSQLQPLWFLLSSDRVSEAPRLTFQAPKRPCSCPVW